MKNSVSAVSLGYGPHLSSSSRFPWADLRKSEIVALLGAAAWALLWILCFRDGGTLQSIEAILALSILVIVPLLVGLTAETGLAGPPVPSLRCSLSYHPIAAALAVCGLVVPIGLFSGALVVPWLVFTCVLGAGGLSRLLRRPWRAASLCVAAGFAYLPIGGVWLCLARFGVDPMRVGEPIVILTAVHFHYAGFALPILATITSRYCGEHGTAPSPCIDSLCCGAISGVPLTAAGISLSPLLEIFGVAIVATTVVGLSILTWFSVVPTIRARAPRMLLRLSALGAMFPIIMAVAYAVGDLYETTLIPIPEMVATHGWINALGFVLAGVLGWVFFDSSRRTETASTTGGDLCTTTNSHRQDRYRAFTCEAR